MAYFHLHHQLAVYTQAFADKRFHRTVRTQHNHLIAFVLGKMLAINRQIDGQLVAVKSVNFLTVGGNRHVSYAGVRKQRFHSASENCRRLLQSVVHLCVDFFFFSVLLAHIDTNIHAAGLLGNRLQSRVGNSQAALASVHIQADFRSCNILCGIHFQADGYLLSLAGVLRHNGNAFRLIFLRLFQSLNHIFNAYFRRSHAFSVNVSFRSHD